MNELAEENNYSTTSIAIKTRSKTSNSFKPISLSSIKDKQKPFISKESTEQQPESNITSKQISIQICPVIVKQRTVTLGFAAPFANSGRILPVLQSLQNILTNTQTIAYVTFIFTAILKRSKIIKH